MRKPAFIVLIGTVLLAALAYSAWNRVTAPQTDTGVDAVIDRLIVPGYAEFHDAARGMASQFRTLCDDASDENLRRTREAFAAAVRAWSRVEYIQFGPVREENRLERIVFYPDRRETGRRQIRQLLAARDGAALEEGAIAGKSAAIQGLPAIEIILFGDGADETSAVVNEPYRCQLGVRIASNIADMAGAIAAQWSGAGGIVQQMKTPGPGNSVFPNGDEVRALVLKTLPIGFETMADTRLASVLGTGLTSARPQVALWRRSGLSREALLANLEGLEALMSASGLLEQLSGETMAEVRTNLLLETAVARRLLSEPSAPWPAIATDSQAYDRLVQIRNAVLRLRQLTVIAIVEGLGLSIGFSPLDGD